MNKQCTRWISALLVVCLLFGTLGGAALANDLTTARFSDVGTGNWFFNAVEFVAHHGIMTGTSGTTFGPGANFSRAMVVTTLFRIYNGRPANITDPRATPFSDVGADRWYAPYIAWAVAKDISDGVGGGRWAPLQAVNRQTFATLLFRFESMAGGNIAIQQGPQWNYFTDRAGTASWARDALIWANYHGLITGVTATTIAPHGNTTRAQASTILSRFVSGDPNALPAPAVNAQQFLGQSFNAVRPQLGDLLESGHPLPGMPSVRYYLFDTWIDVWVENGVLVLVDVVPFHAFGAPFHFSGLSTASTRADAIARFGPPIWTEQELYNGVLYHYYDWVTDTTEILLDFANDRLFLASYASRSFLERAFPLEALEATRTTCTEARESLLASLARNREARLAMLGAQ